VTSTGGQTTESAVVNSEVADNGIATVTFQRGRYNYFNADLLSRLADKLESLAVAGARVIVLASSGRHFCAGADFSSNDPAPPGAASSPIYSLAPRLFAQPLPIIAAVRGAAIGGGLGLALVADFRVACPDSRFAANFAKLGISQGFALSLTLPRLVGPQRASEMFYTGRTVYGEEAHAIGLCDRLTTAEQLNQEAFALAESIASSAPLAVSAIRRSLRAEVVQQVTEALQAEWKDQTSLKLTADFREGVSASKERRTPVFRGE
jgi:2-(1,2-epoxy-1,2-dihydrophenyl)acetyl-CoA isomerase